MCDLFDLDFGSELGFGLLSDFKTDLSLFSFPEPGTTPEPEPGTTPEPEPKHPEEPEQKIRYVKPKRSKNRISECEYEGCSKLAKFGNRDKIARRCVWHRGNLYDVTVDYCKFSKCRITATWRSPNSLTWEFCTTHKKPGMIDTKTYNCKERGCEGIAYFGFPDTLEREYCREHQKPGMIDVHKKCCKHPECFKPASFHFPHLKPEFCGKHRQRGMVYFRRSQVKS